jgi:hypothetical protein
MKLLLAALALVPAFAQADTWTVTYADMPDNWAGPATISVVFAAVDANANGVIEQVELSDLSLQTFGRTYAVWPLQQGQSGRGPIASVLDAFTFDTHQHTLDGFFQGINGEDMLLFMGPAFYQDAAIWSTVGVTPAVSVVSADPVTAVPEPSTLALTALGLLTLLRFGPAQRRERSTRES